MPRLFVDKSIEINAPAEQVWAVITQPEFNKYWSKEFSPDIAVIASDWQMGSKVLWNDLVGTPIVEGKITKIEPEKIVRFSVQPVGQKPNWEMKEDDGITFKLEEIDGQTFLVILHGDFGLMPEHRLFYEMSEKTWDRVLPKIKSLAENN